MLESTGPGASFEGEWNLSRQGAFLQLRRPSMCGARIELALPLEGGARSVQATVVHTNVPGNLRRTRAPIGMGVRFDAPTPVLQRRLDEAVARRSSELLV